MCLLTACSVLRWHCSQAANLKLLHCAPRHSNGNLNQSGVAQPCWCDTGRASILSPQLRSVAQVGLLRPCHSASGLELGPVQGGYLENLSSSPLPYTDPTVSFCSTASCSAHSCQRCRVQLRGGAFGLLVCLSFRSQFYSLDNVVCCCWPPLHLYLFSGCKWTIMDLSQHLTQGRRWRTCTRGGLLALW